MLHRCRFIIASSSDPRVNYYDISTQKLQIQHNCIQWPKYHYLSTQKTSIYTDEEETSQYYIHKSG